MNTCCPGSVRTELARELALKGAVMRAIIAVYFFLFAKMPENGARTYMAALVTTESEHVSDLSLPSIDQSKKKTQSIPPTGRV